MSSSASPSRCDWDQSDARLRGLKLQMRDYLRREIPSPTTAKVIFQPSERHAWLVVWLGTCACACVTRSPPPPVLPSPATTIAPPFVPRSAPPSPPLPPSAVADVCRGARIVLDAEMSACACHERDMRLMPNGQWMERAGEVCAYRPSPDAPLPTVTVSLEKSAVSPTEDARVLVVFENRDAETHVYRALQRYTTARFVQANGALLPRVSLGSGPGSDEAMFELAPGGTATMVVEARHSPAVWLDARTVARRPLRPGTYAVEVQLGNLGGVRVLPIEVRRAD